MNMKSSSSAFLGKNPHRSVVGWRPVEFELPKNQAPQITVEEILDLFIGEETNQHSKKRSGVHNRAVFTADETLDVSSWEPEQEYQVPEPGKKQHSMNQFSQQQIGKPHFQKADSQFSNGIQNETDRRKSASQLKAEASKQAEKIIANAQEQARQMIEDAQQESETIIIQAHEQLNEAMEKAHQMGLLEAEEETRTILQTVNTMLDQVSAWKEEVVTQSQEIVIEIVREISQTMFGSGLVLNNEALQQNLNRILENAKNIGNLKLYLNPNDAVNLDPYWREFQASMTGNMVQIVPSEGITPGGCFIHGEMGSVDARIETQMRTIMETLQTDFSQGEDY
ncbi:MAG: hypothetical protein CL609_04245 [Anaerolineaceae bacterium]|nr:hypothetical protein [Anaerolineaceae bacterium]